MTGAAEEEAGAAEDTREGAGDADADSEIIEDTTSDTTWEEAEDEADVTTEGKVAELTALETTVDMLSNAAVPFLVVLKAPETLWLIVLFVDQTIGQVSASAVFGTEVHHRKSWPPNTANPGLDEFPEAIIPFRKLTA